jgi:hypothetical protein
METNSKGYFNGNAIVTFQREKEAKKAVYQFDGKTLDGLLFLYI